MGYWSIQGLPLLAIPFVPTKFGHSNKIEETFRYFTVVMFIMQYKVALTFVSVKEMLTFDHSNESY